MASPSWTCPPALYVTPRDSKYARSEKSAAARNGSEARAGPQIKTETMPSQPAILKSMFDIFRLKLLRSMRASQNLHSSGRICQPYRCMVPGAAHLDPASARFFSLSRPSSPEVCLCFLGAALPPPRPPSPFPPPLAARGGEGGGGRGYPDD